MDGLTEGRIVHYVLPDGLPAKGKHRPMTYQYRIVNHTDRALMEESLNAAEADGWSVHSYSSFSSPERYSALLGKSKTALPSNGSDGPVDAILSAEDLETIKLTLAPYGYTVVPTATPVLSSVTPDTPIQTLIQTPDTDTPADGDAPNPEPATGAEASPEAPTPISDGENPAETPPPTTEEADYAAPSPSQEN